MLFPAEFVNFICNYFGIMVDGSSAIDMYLAIMLVGIYFVVVFGVPAYIIVKIIKLIKNNGCKVGKVL